MFIFYVIVFSTRHHNSCKPDLNNIFKLLTGDDCQVKGIKMPIKTDTDIVAIPPSPIQAHRLGIYSFHHKHYHGYNRNRYLTDLDC